MNSKVRLQLSVMMFLQFFIWGSWAVTMGTYLNNTMKFSGAQIGMAYSTAAWAAILSPFFVGMIADRFFAAEKVLAFLHLLGAAFMFWASHVREPMMFFWVLLLYTLCYMPTLALTNAISFHQMTNPDREFPGIRVLGTIGWIVAGLVIYLLQKIGFNDIESTAIPLRIAAGVSVLMGILCFSLPPTPPKSVGQRITARDILGLEALKLMKERSFSVFVISSLLICIPLAFYYNFTNLFLNELHVKGAAGKMTLGQMSEIFFMLVMPFFFVRLGVKRMLLIGMLAWTVRYVLFAFGDTDTHSYMLYIGILLHGICYDFFFVTGQIYVDQKAPVAIRAQAQGFLAFVTLGIGMLIGTNLSGRIVDHYTEPTIHAWNGIWIIPAMMAGVIGVFFLLLFNEKGKAAMATAPENIEKENLT